jgi:hypothetical protein
MNVPLVPGTLRGYRFWVVAPGDLRLRSIGVNAAWTQSAMTAECLALGPSVPCSSPQCMACRDGWVATHRAPALECTCGLYGVHYPLDEQIINNIGMRFPPGLSAEGWPSLVHDCTPVLGIDEGPFGVISASGRVIVGTRNPRGFRAERAKIEAIAYCLPLRVEYAAARIVSVPEASFIDRLTLARVPAIKVICESGQSHVRPLRTHIGQFACGINGIDSARLLDRRLRERYPDVEVYGDYRAMIEKYPPLRISNNPMFQQQEVRFDDGSRT